MGLERVVDGGKEIEDDLMNSSIASTSRMISTRAFSIFHELFGYVLSFSNLR